MAQKNLPLETLREYLDLTVSEFADELELQRTHCYGYEAGRIPVGGRVAIRIEDAFGAHFDDAGITLSELLRGEFARGRRK